MPPENSAVIALQFAADGPEPHLEENVGRWADAAIRACGRSMRKQLGVTVRIVSEAESSDLNFRFRGIQKPTNVLAFPVGEVVLPTRTKVAELGDLAICMAIVRREASQQNKELQAHLAHMMVHGTLHLLGYDHLNDSDATAMEACEIEALESLGYPNPYATQRQ